MWWVEDVVESRAVPDRTQLDLRVGRFQWRGHGTLWFPHKPDRANNVFESNTLHGWLAVVHQQAIQLHVAYSQTFIGMGAIAGGPYFCTRATPALLAKTTTLTAHARRTQHAARHDQVRWTILCWR